MKKNDEHDFYCVATMLINQLHTLPDAKPEDNHWTLSLFVNRRDTLVKDGIRLKNGLHEQWQMLIPVIADFFTRLIGKRHCTFEKPIRQPDINGINEDAKPLITAAEYGNFEIVQYLIQEGADVNKTPIIRDGDKTGSKAESALMAAVTGGWFDIVRLLVKKGANLEYQNEYSNKDTAVILAAGKGSRNILEYLLQKDGIVNYQNEFGETALMRAVSMEEIDNIKTLLAYNADTKLKNDQGLTALDIAKDKNYSEIISILEKY